MQRRETIAAMLDAIKLFNVPLLVALAIVLLPPEGLLEDPVSIDDPVMTFGISWNQSFVLR